MLAPLVVRRPPFGVGCLVVDGRVVVDSSVSPGDSSIQSSSGAVSHRRLIRKDVRPMSNCFSRYVEAILARLLAVLPYAM